MPAHGSEFYLMLDKFDIYVKFSLSKEMSVWRSSHVQIWHGRLLHVLVQTAGKAWSRSVNNQLWWTVINTWQQ